MPVLAGRDQDRRVRAERRREIDDSDGPAGEARGEIVVEPQFQQAWYFVDGLARVREGDHWGYIDREGEMVIPARYDLAWDFDGPLALVLTEDGYGYIDRDGTFVTVDGMLGERTRARLRSIFDVEVDRTE